MNKVEHFRVAVSPFKTRYDNYIGGKWTAPKAGRYFENITPVTGQKLCEIARSDASDVEAALDALKAGVSKVHIVDGRQPHSLLFEIFSNTGIGTEIVP